MKVREDLNNKDHKVAAWLRANGWTGDFTKYGSMNVFYAGEVPIAVITYNNSDCTYKVVTFED